MMEVISYENVKGIATVGFKENDFVVYASVHFINGESREKLLQRAYKKAKTSIDYELTQDDHAFVTEETGDEFIPDEPALESIVINGINNLKFAENEESKSVELHATTLDQYGDDIETELTWEASEGTLEGSNLTLQQPTSQTDVTVTASSGTVESSKTFTVYPYTEPEVPVEEPNQSADVQELKEIVDTMLGVDKIE